MAICQDLNASQVKAILLQRTILALNLVLFPVEVEWKWNHHCLMNMFPFLFLISSFSAASTATVFCRRAILLSLAPVKSMKKPHTKQ